MLKQHSLCTPAYVLNTQALADNARGIAQVCAASGAKALLALKGFATWPAFDHLQPHPSGATVSSPWEALLAREHLPGQIHAYAPGYSAQDIQSLLDTGVSHITFNSLTQLARFAPKVRKRGVSTGLRINPQHRETQVALYDPCAPDSRLGVSCQLLAQADRALLAHIDGLHMHTLCQKNSDALTRTWAVVKRDFAPWLSKLSWFNIGGGHHITTPEYDTAQLVCVLQDIANTTGGEVFLEPGEAWGLGAGVLATSVLDIVQAPNGAFVAVMDTSATAHMPDVLEAPYRPEIWGAKPCSDSHQADGHPFMLGGLTCLAGDSLGCYDFSVPLQVGQRLVLGDMAHYTMVKTTFFNGVRHPDIVLYTPGDLSEKETMFCARRFDYLDFRARLGARL